jgi:hypothetical protein
MRFLKASYSSLSFIFFVLAIFAVPINADFASLRLTDLFIVISVLFLVGVNKIDKNVMGISIFLGLVLILIILSQLFGLHYSRTFRFEGVIFFIKWLLIYSSLIIIYFHLIKFDSNPQLIVKGVLFVFVVLSIWVYLYIYLVTSGVIHGSFRVSFPLSNDYLASDAHLYSSLLAILLFSYVFFLRILLDHNLYVSTLLTITGFIALFLTGSRGGLLMLFVGSIPMGFYYLFVKKMTYLSLTKLSFLLVTVGVFILYFSFIFEFSDNYQALVSRAINFDLTSDQSSQGRLHKLAVAISETSYSGLFIGVGPFSAELDWYDGLIAILISHGGILLLVTVLVSLSIFVFKVLGAKSNLYLKFLFFAIVSMYFVSNVITEYVFVTRSFFPVFIVIGLIVQYINDNNKIYRR